MAGLSDEAHPRLEVQEELAQHIPLESGLDAASVGANDIEYLSRVQDR